MMKIPLNKIIAREYTKPAVIRHLVGFPASSFPPVKVKKWAEVFLLLDGHHRYEAARLRGEETIEAELCG